MTIEETIGTLVLAIIDEGTYVKVAREKSPFGGHVYTFMLITTARDGIKQGQFRATSTELEQSSDIRVIADFMRSQMK